MRVWHSRKWCRELQNCQMDMNYDDFTQWQVTPTMDVNTAQVQETILETL